MNTAMNMMHKRAHGPSVMARPKPKARKSQGTRKAPDSAKTTLDKRSY